MEKATARMMSLLDEFDWQVLSLNEAGPGKALFTDRGFPVFDLDYDRWRPWKTIFPARARIRCARPDFLLMTGHNLWGSFALPKRGRLPSTLWLHFHHTGVMNPILWRAIYVQALAAFDQVVFASEFIRCEALAIEPRLAKRSIVLYNPLQLEHPPAREAKCEARRMLGLPQDAIIIGNAGWLIQRKRFDVFLRVIRVLAQSNPAVFGCVAGHGPLLADLQQMARELGVAGRVRFVGLLADMEPFYHSLDTLLFNSDWDAFPTTPLEAMAHGVPTVVSCLNSGLKEIFGPDLLQRFYKEEHDPEALASLVRQAVSTPELASLQRARVAQEMDPVSQARKFRRVLTGSACG